jgi:hypothetical protein
VYTFWLRKPEALSTMHLASLYHEYQHALHSQRMGNLSQVTTEALRKAQIFLSNNTNSTQALSTSIIRNINKTIAISANY